MERKTNDELYKSTRTGEWDYYANVIFNWRIVYIICGHVS